MMVDQSVPPAELMAYASGSQDAGLFRAIGDEFLRHFRELADLQPNACVLDIGCGCGRIALALADYLDKRSRYEGLDVDSASIEWATANITPRYPSFQFQRADVFNTTYNPKGAVPPHEYRLPFAENTFDFVYLTSVFTHMLPSGMQNYLAEIARVLKVNGKCLITMFLLNASKAPRVQSGASVFKFPHRSRACYVQDIDRPEDVVGYNEAWVVRQFRRQGLKLLRPPMHGTWSGISDGRSFQDFLLAQKTTHRGPIGRKLAQINWLDLVRRSKFQHSAAFAGPTV